MYRLASATLVVVCVAAHPFSPSLVQRVDSPSPPAGTRLEVQSCQPGVATQTWTLSADGSIRNTASGLCITAAGSGNPEPGPLTTEVCASPVNGRQVFDADALTGIVSLRGSSPALVMNASFGSWNYGWVRPYAPLGLAYAAGVSPSNSTGYAPFQTFVVNSPTPGSIVANASTLSASVCVDAGFRAPLTLVASVFGSHMILQVRWARHRTPALGELRRYHTTSCIAPFYRSGTRTPRRSMAGRQQSPRQSSCLSCAPANSSPTYRRRQTLRPALGAPSSLRRRPTRRPGLSRCRCRVSRGVCCCFYLSNCFCDCPHYYL